MINQKFVITNLTCPACIKLSTMALKKIPDVNEVMIDLATGAAEITSDRDVTWNEISEALKSVDKNAVQIN